LLHGHDDRFDGGELSVDLVSSNWVLDGDDEQGTLDFFPFACGNASIAARVKLLGVPEGDEPSDWCCLPTVGDKLVEARADEASRPEYGPPGEGVRDCNMLLRGMGIGSEARRI
jgi:hypothetical protein